MAKEDELTRGCIVKIDLAKIDPELAPTASDKVLGVRTKLFHAVVDERLAGHLLVVVPLFGTGAIAIREEYLELVQPVGGWLTREDEN